MSKTARALDSSGLPDTLSSCLELSGGDGQSECLLLIDAAALPENEVLAGVYAYDHRPVWSWLFRDTDFSEIADAGPLVVETRFGSRLVNQAIARWAQSGLLLIKKSGPTDALLAGLRSSLILRLASHGPCFIRSYDTRFLQILKACQPDQLRALIGTSTRWFWTVDRGDATDWDTMTGTLREHPGLNPSQTHDFERMLGWIQGWCEHEREARQLGVDDLKTLCAFIRHQWFEGVTWPCRDLDHLLRRFLVARGPEAVIANDGFSPSTDREGHSWP